MKRQIPNLITLCNLLCGVFSCIYAAQGHLILAALFICLGIFFDFFDGMAARLLGVSSPLGKELDSLADVVTSGVAPGVILFELLASSLVPWLKWVGLFTPLFSAYRLAKFNLDTRQTHSFIGLPTPANALIWVGFGTDAAFVTDHIWITISIALLSVATGIMMVNEVPMFSLKVNFKDLSWKTNVVQYTFLIGCGVIAIIGIIASLDFLFLPLFIIWYILLSLITQKKENAQ
ncbi:MAG: CDP-diacylglycerol--serine O-phosphatidyltransferase [Bacteroidales bacterium]|nr:CDP-diacylglycerol--serine O-phosphatidyltransferase [Bacteroidales bacterium]